MVCIIADGMGTNRKMFLELNNMKLPLPYRCRNIYDPEKDIYLISDPPHLLKTSKNNIWASKEHGNKLLKCNEHYILWRNFRSVLKLFVSKELRCCKLTDANFNLHSRSKMTVCYATQLFSKSVRLNYGYYKHLIPYKDVNDPHLMSLSDTFINDLDNWKRKYKR